MTENLESEVAIHEQTMNITHETALPSRTHNKVGNSKVNLHWRNFLENMLQQQGVSDDGVVRSCIQDALASSSFSFERNFKMNDVTDDIVQCKDESKGCFAVQGQCQRPEKSGDAEMEVSETSAHCLHAHIQTVKCSNVFREILLSEKFALLCDLLQENFQGVKLSSIFDLSLINSQMENGCYERFPDLFDQDIQLVWEKFQKIGEEMVSLARSLSSISRTSYQKQIGEGLARENAKQKFEESYQVEQSNAIDSHRFASEFPCELYQSAKPDQTETSCKVRASTYEHYENEADGKHSITCDGCESMCHFSCSELVTDVVPIRSSYHTACSTNGCDTHEHAKTNSEQDNLLEECVVCERLEVPETLDDLIDSGRESTEFDQSRESSISRTEPAERQQVPMVAISHLCKRCGTCEETDKGLLVCGNQLCPYKFYHIRCLKGSERAIQKQSLGCWYCPSCLCRVCLSDINDDMIVMCDGCDEAYHTYCMRPPCSAIPRDKWYCFSCSVVKPRQGMKKYGQKILLQEENQSMDMLLRAAEKLSSEETLAAGREHQ
ncbi:hypothetical protein J5N97_020029 [Dioscorea zingiberensis]|uniref:PHD-type domain-containing protein n=1 Tax=Dioscorea zingiberensis TaxID=325984 RepID=A0A9D5CH65_9LILI|nr:hypothetical protein J5N97_020029 [Dioscorea zingiberensis]